MSNIIKISDLEKHFSKEIVSLYNEANKNNDPKIYLTIINKAPEFLPAYNNLSEIYIRENDFNAAVDILKNALEILSKNDPKTNIFGAEMTLIIRLNMAIAANAVQPNHYDMIIKILNQWPLQNNGLPKEHQAQASFLLGRALYAKNLFPQSLPYLEYAYQNLNQNESIQVLLADAYYRTENFSASVKIYDKFINKKSNFELRQRHGMSLLRNGEFKKAEKLFTGLLDEFLDQSGRRSEYEALLKEINEKIASKKSSDVDEKISTIENDSNLDPDQKDKELGFLYILKGEYNKAMEFLGKAADKVKGKLKSK